MEEDWNEYYDTFGNPVSDTQYSSSSNDRSNIIDPGPFGNFGERQLAFPVEEPGFGKEAPAPSEIPQPSTLPPEEQFAVPQENELYDAQRRAQGDAGQGPLPPEEQLPGEPLPQYGEQPDALPPEERFAPQGGGMGDPKAGPMPMEEFSPYDPRRFAPKEDNKLYFMARPNFDPRVDESMRGGQAYVSPGFTKDQLAESLAQQGQLPFRNKAEYDQELARRADAREKYIIAAVESGEITGRDTRALQEYRPAKMAQEQKRIAQERQIVNDAETAQGMSPQARNQMAALQGAIRNIDVNPNLTSYQKEHLKTQARSQLAPLLQQQSVTLAKQQQIAQQQRMQERAQNTAMNTGEWQAYLNKTLSHVPDGVGGTITSFMTPDGKTHTTHASAPKGVSEGGVQPFDEVKAMAAIKQTARASLAAEEMARSQRGDKNAILPFIEKNGTTVKNPDFENFVIVRQDEMLKAARAKHEQAQRTRLQPQGGAAPPQGPMPQGQQPPQQQSGQPARKVTPDEMLKESDGIGEYIKAANPEPDLKQFLQEAQIARTQMAKMVASGKKLAELPEAEQKAYWDAKKKWEQYQSLQKR